MADAVDHVGLQAKLRPDHLACHDLGLDRRWSYAEFDRTVGQCAGALLARGVGVGDRVGSLSKNRAELIILHLACARIGAIYVPFNWRLAAVEIAALVEDAEPKLVFGDAWAEAAAIAHVDIGGLLGEIEASPPAPAAQIDLDRPSLILYTSGTSGRPKGVLLTERNLLATAINTTLLCLITGETGMLCDAPMFHVLGLVTTIRPVLMQGGTLRLSDAFIPARTLDRLADPALAVTHYFCVPQMAAAMRAEPGFAPERLRRMTAIFTGGAPHPAPSIQAWVDDGIAIVNGFGMSETGTVFHMPVDRALIARSPGACGVPTPGLQARIVDANEKDRPVGEAGELLLKGDNVTKGYWRRPTETAAAFTADGWLRTGDIARLDANGYYWLVDRRKDMFISGGENVYPAEIEAVLANHPDIAECAVVGVPDETWGEVGHLVMAPHAGRTIDTAAVLALLETRLARYKRPKHVTQLDRLPRNAGGKVLKEDLRRQLGA